MARKAHRRPAAQRARSTTRTVVSDSRIIRASLVSVQIIDHGQSMVTLNRFAWSLPARAVAALLIVFFIAVPVGDAYANTSESVDMVTPVVVSDEAESAPVEHVSSEDTLVDEVVAENIETVEESIDTQQEVVVQGDTPQVLVEHKTIIDETSVEPISTHSEEVIENTEDIRADSTTAIQGEQTVSDSDTVVSESNADEETPVTSVEVTATTTVQELSVETATTSVELTTELLSTTTTEELLLPVSVEPITPTTTPTTTLDVVPENSTHTTDADKFTFGLTECVPVGNGAFHCVRPSSANVQATERGPLYAARDQSGDMEIYQTADGVTRSLTANEYDDDAPQQDVATRDIVWHAQIDDRYQVMHYDFETGATTRITKEAYNSMQPSIYDGDIVFQAWIGDDWEVVLIDDTDGRKILTDNTEHDIAPTITREYIMWQAMENGEWVGRIYDRTSKEIETVRGVEGGKVENPRMIMVFDSTKDNGDTETIGYDPVTGEVVSLAVASVPLPERIPEPEQEQEEKALVQPSTTTRTETKSATSTDSEGDSEGDTVVENASSTVSVALEVAATSTQVNATIDLTVPTSGSAPLIPDLVIPAFNTSSDEATTSPSV